MNSSLQLVVNAAVAGLVAMGAEALHATPTGGQGKCIGSHGCHGASKLGCAGFNPDGSAHSCKGKNTCGGSYRMLPEADCLTKGGKFELVSAHQDKDLKLETPSHKTKDNSKSK